MFSWYMIISLNSNLTQLKNKVDAFTVNWSVTGDCNDLYKGIFSGYNLKNAPTTNWTTILSMPANGNPLYNIQIATIMGSNTLYIRHCFNGTWSSWRAI